MPSSIRPIASPVNHFVRPAEPTQHIGPTKAEQLATALSQFAPAAFGFAQHQVERVDQAQVDLARDQRTKTALNYKEAIQKGIITPDQSPVFVKAWKEQDGRVAADQYNADLIVALSTGPFASSTDHKETESLLNTFRQNWIEHNGIETNNPAFMDGFAAKAQAYEATVRQHQAAAIGQRIVGQTTENTYHEILGVFDDASSRDLPASSTADGISLITQRGILVGMDPKDVNRIVLDAAISKAIETNSIAPFNVLDQVKTGTGFLGRTKEALLARESIQNQISQRLIDLDNHAFTQAQRKRDELERTTSAAVFGALFQNDLNGLPTTLQAVAPQIQELSQVDPMKAHELEEIVLNSNKPRPQYDNESTRKTLTVDLFENNLKQGTITSAYRAGLITVETAKDLTDRLHAHQREGIADSRYASEQDRVAKPKNIQQIPAFSEAAAGIRRSFGEDPFGFNKLDPQVTDKMNDALSSFYISAQQWREANPNATMEDFLTKANELRKKILELYPPLSEDSNLSGKSPISKEPLKIIPPQGPVATLVTPQTPTAAPKRYFGSEGEWEAALLEYGAKRSADSALGKIIEQLGLKEPADIAAFVKAQNALY